MKPENIPDEADDEARSVMLERIPDECPKCGEDLYVYGGRLKPEMGLYEHIDPMVTCRNGCKQMRFTMGTAKSGEIGRQFRALAGDWEDDFDGISGYCDLHNRRMKPTKDLLMTVEGEGNGREKVKARQFKCPECDLETVVTVE